MSEGITHRWIQGEAKGLSGTFLAPLRVREQ